jgi:hypothetical protein
MLRVRYTGVVVSLVLGCGAEPKRAGEPCESDDECPAGLECMIKTCSDGPTISFCTRDCVGGDDCSGFSQPYCEYLGGLGRSCIEKGNNPCPQPP